MIPALLLLLAQRGYVCAVTDPAEIARRLPADWIELPLLGQVAAVGMAAECRVRRPNRGARL